jgi:uncharacterized protein
VLRAVLDANVLISGLIARHSPSSRILDAWIAGQVQVCLSPKILKELKYVLKYTHIRQRLTIKESASLLSIFEKIGEIVEGKVVFSILTRDPSDNIYLACAVEGNVDFLVTGNIRRFQEVGETYNGITIVSPGEFLEMLKIE